MDLPCLCSIDRAGIVGEDGPTHHGVFDVSILSKQLLFTLLPQKLSKEQKRYITDKKIKTIPNSEWVNLFKGITCNLQQK